MAKLGPAAAKAAAVSVAVALAAWRKARVLGAAAVAGFRQTWRAQPRRRPVLVALVLVPALLAALLASPAQMRGVQAASPAPGPAPVVTPARPNAAAPNGNFEREFQKRNPFRIRNNRVLEAPPPVPTPVPRPTVPPPQGPPPDTKLKLLGTFLVGDQRFAVLNLVQKGKEDVFKENDAPLPNSRITRIAAREIEVILDGQAPATLQIDYSDWSSGKGGPGVATAPPVQGYAPPQGDAPPLPVPPAPAEGQPRRLARSEVDGYLDNLNTLLTQVNVQPVFQAGQPAGFRLSDIQKGTILDQIGVQDGDTLRFVNGQRIDSVQSAFQLYNILKESTNVEITVIRNTRPVTLRYLIY